MWTVLSPPPHLERIIANWNLSAVTAIKARLLAEIEGKYHFSNYTSFICQRKGSLPKDSVLGKRGRNYRNGVHASGLGEKGKLCPPAHATPVSL